MKKLITSVLRDCGYSMKWSQDFPLFCCTGSLVAFVVIALIGGPTWGLALSGSLAVLAGFGVNLKNVQE